MLKHFSFSQNNAGGWKVDDVRHDCDHKQKNDQFFLTLESYNTFLLILCTSQLLSATTTIRQIPRFYFKSSTNICICVEALILFRQRVPLQRINWKCIFHSSNYHKSSYFILKCTFKKGWHFFGKRQSKSLNVVS